jgi:hypothetical protein
MDDFSSVQSEQLTGSLLQSINAFFVWVQLTVIQPVKLYVVKVKVSLGTL